MSFILAAGHVRFAHTDIQVPDFSEYRRDTTSDPKKPASTSSTDRQMFSYLLVGGGTIAATYGAKNIVTDFIQTMNASADVLAMAKIEIKLEEIPEVRIGQFITKFTVENLKHEQNCKEGWK